MTAPLLVTRWLSHSPADTRRLLTRLVKQLHGGDIVGLIGPLGAGKTFIAQTVAKKLGITQPLRSPSFTLIQPYALPKPINNITTLVHVDAYRVTAAQLLAAGLEDYLGLPETLIIIEWADRIKSRLKQPVKLWRIDYAGQPQDRQLTIG